MGTAELIGIIGLAATIGGVVVGIVARYTRTESKADEAAKLATTSVQQQIEVVRIETVLSQFTDEMKRVREAINNLVSTVSEILEWKGGAEAFTQTMQRDFGALQREQLDLRNRIQSLEKLTNTIQAQHLINHPRT